MELLEKSQTFIGVIMTLNVLCIFLDEKNNFIMRLVAGMSGRLISYLADFERKIADSINKFKESESYLKVVEIAGNSSHVSRQVKTKAQILNYETTINVFGYQADISESYLPIDSVKKYIEQVLAPIYCLGYGLLIFLLDEVSHFLPKESPAFIFAIFVSLIISSIYWISIWSTFMIHSAQPHEKRPKGAIWQLIDCKLGVYGGAILKYLLCGFIYFAILRWFTWETLNAFGKIVINVLSFSLPISLIGIVRLSNCNIKGYYSYSHCIGHLLAIIVYSAIIGLIFKLEFPVAYTDIGFLADKDILAFAIAIFLLLNGIISPFFFPMWRCKIFYNRKKREIEFDEQRICGFIAAFPDKYDRLAMEIGKEVINSKIPPK